MSMVRSARKPAKRLIIERPHPGYPDPHKVDPSRAGEPQLMLELQDASDPDRFIGNIVVYESDLLAALLEIPAESEPSR